VLILFIAADLLALGIGGGQGLGPAHEFIANGLGELPRAFFVVALFPIQGPSGLG